ncbi:replicative DNA helicase [Kitasatospora sp. NPDC059088]|uniref:replicative DNA helicase n=1 Tax=Kitasatospora sp. NPDC059088 TaxID=3346722 RepID=UPI0036B6D9FB
MDDSPPPADTEPDTVGQLGDDDLDRPGATGDAGQAEREERALLAAMMQASDLAGDVAALLRAEDFHSPANGLIFLAVLDLLHQGVDPDPVAVVQQLEANGDLERIGGQQYFDLVAGSDASAGRAVKRAHRIRQEAMRRRLRRATSFIDRALASTASVDDVIALAEREVLTATDPDHRLGIPLLADVLEDALDVVEAVGSRGSARMLGLPTGFPALDALTGGLQPGHLIVIGSRPAMGTSTLALDFLRACTIHCKVPAALFTLQLGHNEVAMRLMAAEARVPVHQMRSGTMDDDSWTRIARRMPDITQAPLYIDESATTLTEIRSKCRRLKRKAGIGLVVIDPVQLLNYGLRQFSSRYEEINETSRHLKLMAKELQIPVVAVSKLNRSPEQRLDKRPQPHDLRDSGTLEDDADLLILLHRDDAYERESPRAGLADLIVAKHVHGPPATIEVAFQGHYSRFVDIVPD